jgi:hypothetical protein
LSLIYKAIENFVAHFTIRRSFNVLPLRLTKLFEGNEVVMGKIEILVALTETGIWFKPFSDSVISGVEFCIFYLPHTVFRLIESLSSNAFSIAKVRFNYVFCLSWHFPLSVFKRSTLGADHYKCLFIKKGIKEIDLF